MNMNVNIIVNVNMNMAHLNLSWLSCNRFESITSSPRMFINRLCSFLASLLMVMAFCGFCCSLVPSLATLNASTPALWK